jgi:hypothetical protein
LSPSSGWASSCLYCAPCLSSSSHCACEACRCLFFLWSSSAGPVSQPYISLMRRNCLYVHRATGVLPFAHVRSALTFFGS